MEGSNVEQIREEYMQEARKAVAEGQVRPKEMDMVEGYLGAMSDGARMFVEGLCGTGLVQKEQILQWAKQLGKYAQETMKLDFIEAAAAFAACFGTAVHLIGESEAAKALKVAVSEKDAGQS